MAQRKQVLEPGIVRRKRQNESRKMNYAATQDLLIRSIESGAQVPEACEAAGVTPAQVRYYKEQNKKFRAAYEAAQRRGLVLQRMPPEKLKRFLCGCKWLCGIDVARECINLTRRELASCFEARPDIKAAALAAQAEGRKMYADENNEGTTPQSWGSAKLNQLLNDALTMEELI